MENNNNNNNNDEVVELEMSPANMAAELAAREDSRYSLSGSIFMCTLLVVTFLMFVLFFGEPDLHSSVICALRGSCGP